MAVQLVKDRVVAVLEHQVELPFAPEHLDQVHQVGVFELLQGGDTATSYCFTAAHEHAVAPGNRLTSRPIYEPPVPSRLLTLPPSVTNKPAGNCYTSLMAVQGNKSRLSRASAGHRPPAGRFIFICSS